MQTTLENLMNEYLNYCSIHKNLDWKTRKAYGIDLRQFLSLIPVNTLPVGKEILMDYLSSIHKMYQPRTIKRKIASVKAFFHYLEYEEMIEFNPFNKIELSFRQPKRLPKTIPSNIIEAFLAAIYKEKNRSMTPYQKKTVMRDIAVMELLFATGIRISELCSLRQGDLDLENKTVLIFGKGAKERMLQIGNEEVIAALSQYKDCFSEELSETEWLFVNRLRNRLSEQSVRYMINRYVAAAGIDMHITPHMFRHSFATLLLEADVDIRYIQKMLGHSSITTTEIYTSVSMSKQREILEGRHPRNGMVVGV
ncbi:MAG: tyrosine-type recombinase/integrase [Roseburia sp.]|nr:tyrosine-type recombinase/integrase [Roseburia sp.]MCM1279701.1 tyrosine-type recombinase/integrase [Robinsoniella sp.]